MEDGNLKIADGNPPGIDLSEKIDPSLIPSGIFITSSATDIKAVDDWLESLGYAGELKAFCKSLCVGVTGKLKKAVTGLADSLSTTVIMPAGDVFMFKGLNTDAQGNVYSGITYSTPSGGEVKAQGEVEKNKGLTTRSFVKDQ